MFESMQNVLYSKLFWFSAIIALFYLYLKNRVYSYWKNHGVPQEDTTVPTGLFGTDFFMKKITLGNVMKKSYEKFKKYPYHGLYMFHKPMLMVNDLELIKKVLVKDFGNFCDRGIFCNSEIDPLSANLFFLSGDTWRIVRLKLTPTFTSGKLKHMYPILKEIANNMIKVSDESLLKTDILELKDIIARYTTDVIFSLAFGLDSNCLKEPNNQFRYYGNLAVKNNILVTSLGFFAPNLLLALRLPIFPSDCSKFFIKLFRDMVEQRRSEKVDRKDFLDSLIYLIEHEQVVNIDVNNPINEMSKGKITKKLDLLEAAAQAFAFFIAGFETSSSIATYCLYELALNPDVQEKVHEEIDDLLKKTDDLTYEGLLQLEYLEMAFYETMRKHPSLAFLNRICVEEYKIPDSDIIIPKNTGIIIPVSGLHSDPDIYPEPNKFDPTRFSKENIATRHPYAFLGFGEGPRICIGKRLGVLQSKTALFYMLKNYKFSVCDKTPIPSKYTIDSVLQTPGSGIYLKTERRKIH